MAQHFDWLNMNKSFSTTINNTVPVMLSRVMVNECAYDSSRWFLVSGIFKQGGCVNAPPFFTLDNAIHTVALACNPLVVRKLSRCLYTARERAGKQSRAKATYSISATYVCGNYNSPLLMSMIHDIIFKNLAEEIYAFGNGTAFE